jgi:GNAT superfamily N-acetyltransferase
MTVPDSSLRIAPVTRDTWADFERLFESKGAPSYCWCMAWRKSAQGTKHANRANLKLAIAGRVNSGVPIGLLGYVGSEPVAWCSVAPRATHIRLVTDGSSDEGKWSITCFFVSRSHRGKGLGRQMLASGVEHAFASGAEVVEGYPVDPDSPSYRFMGFVSTFAEAGFEACGRAGSRRHVMQLRAR